MNERYGAYSTQTGAATKERDEGLRQYMLKVYNYLASGVFLTGVVAMLASSYAVSSEAAFTLMYASGFSFVIKFAPLALMLIMSFGANRMSSGTLQAMFWALSVALGLSLSSIFFQYTGVSIARTFFITAASFGALSLYGYTTKKSLSGFGTFLFMGLIGLFIAMIVNMFLGSSMLHFMISAGGVLIFAGFTAYDTQRIKHEYYYLEGGEMMAKGAIWGAVSLYLDFINLFMFLLSFLGDRE